MKTVLIVSLAIFALGSCRPSIFKPKCDCSPSDEPACGEMPDGSLEDFENSCKAGCAGAINIKSGHCDAHKDHDLKKQQNKDSEKHAGQNKGEDKEKDKNDYKGKSDSSEEVGGPNTDDNVHDTTTAPTTRDLVSETISTDQTSVVTVSEICLDGASQTTSSDPTTNDAEHDSSTDDPTINDAENDSSTADPTINDAEHDSSTADPTINDAEHDSSTADPTINDAEHDSSTADQTISALFESSAEFGGPGTDNGIIESTEWFARTDDCMSWMDSTESWIDSTENMLPCGCEPVDEPVCGLGYYQGYIDYRNKCEAECLSADDIQSGTCEENGHETCACEGHSGQTVCGTMSDGSRRHFESACWADCINATDITEGECMPSTDHDTEGFFLPSTAREYPPCSCMPGEPVCAVHPDGTKETYSGDCEATCYHHAKVLHNGPCESETDE